MMIVTTELPDAPAEVQVEAGPQHGTLLVMWLPVKVTERSCTAAITGYSVYVDGRRVKELQSPTGTFRVLVKPPRCSQESTFEQ